MTLSQIGRLWRTARWLRAGQVFGRVRQRLQVSRPDTRAAPSRRSVAGPWVQPPAREASLIGPTLMRFLGEAHDLDALGWDDGRLPLLWRYNQHYFDDLNAAGAPGRRSWHLALVQRWCDENPPRRSTAWSPYPTSLRIVNWVKWSSGGAPMAPDWVHSLAVQARWLANHLEWHLLGNHLLANAKALVFAGLWFEGAEAETWLAKGLQILDRELPEQILADAGQFERSPMYHAIALEDLLDLLNVITALGPASSAQRLVPSLRERSVAMIYWLRCLLHPGGKLARFNDCAEGIAPPIDELERYARDLGVVASAPEGEGLLALEASGYVRAARGRALALLDVAPIGPDYLPGHAHADTLSFELSIGSRELIVNRGTSIYGDGPRRQWERGTAAHSTVQIGSHDSSEVWAGFRVGRRARPGPLQRDEWSIESSHDGYAHLPGAPQHRRRWTLHADSLEVDDWIEPASHEPAMARFHLAPGLFLQQATPESWLVLDGAGTLAKIEVPLGSASPATTLHAQRFGVLTEASTLAVQLVDGRAAVRLTWDA